MNVFRSLIGANAFGVGKKRTTDFPAESAQILLDYCMPENTYKTDIIVSLVTCDYLNNFIY